VALDLAGHTARQVMVGPTSLHVLQGGTGPPCLVLHGIEGDEGWLAFHAALAERATVYAPSHPGFGRTPCPEWIRGPRHQAVFYNWFLQQAQLSDVTLLGLGVGGWIAAEMAVMCTARLARLVLVNPAGLKPRQSEILDVFVTPWSDVIQRSFHARQTAPEYERIYGSGIADYGGIREAGRTMLMRMCFKPYLHDPSLEGMLPKIDVPTLVVASSEDAILPAECAEQYRAAIPGAELRTLSQCGHFAHLEQPRELADLIMSSWIP
jgi:pimeloyl-ACP methyl ester carboxylesterase